MSENFQFRPDLDYARDAFRNILNFDQFQPDLDYVRAWQPCPAALPSSLSRQPCPPALPASLARQPCPPALQKSLQAVLRP
jgi:hypothetical protein